MRRLLSVFVVVAASATFVTPVYATEEVLRPPSSSDVLDHFRAPAGPYGAGNRGIEYDTAADDPVVAAGSGLVVFAGPVGGRLHITIDHGDGLLSSYSFVDTLTVRRGTQVTAGQHIAVADGPFHFGTRLGGEYVDPASLFGVREVSVALVPHSDPDAMDRYLDLMDRSERLRYASWLLPDKPSVWKQLLDGAGDLIGGTVGIFVDLVTEPFTVVDLGALVARLEAIVKWAAEVIYDVAVDVVSVVDLEALQAQLLDLAESAIGTITETALRLAYISMLDIIVAAALALAPGECTKPEVRPARTAGRRIAVLVAGLGSSSDSHAAIDDLDLAALGYEPGDIVRAGYGIGSDGSVDYDPQDTFRPVEESAEVLLAQLRQIAAQSPGIPIDVYAHSLGGVVSAQAIATGEDGLVDSLITFATPFGGTPAAELANTISDSLAPQALLADLVWPDESLGSAVVDELQNPSIAIRDGFASSTRLLTFGHSNDMIVPAHLARVPGHTHVILGSGGLHDIARSISDHSAITSHPDVLREIMLFRAGRPPTCTGLLDRMSDAVAPRLKTRGIATLGHLMRAGDPSEALRGGFIPFAGPISPFGNRSTPSGNPGGAPGGWRRYSFPWPE